MSESKGKQRSGVDPLVRYAGTDRLSGSAGIRRRSAADILSGMRSYLRTDDRSCDHS